jgi:mannitol-1-phosphate 5-dehydrogenase
MSKPMAIQFGAGNIGRGFIGVLLTQSGYGLIFVDVVEPLVEAINRQGQYTIEQIQTGERVALTIEDVRAINGRNETEVAEAISQASLITTAVGPNVLRIIASVIAKGLQQRAALNITTPLNIIACENLIDNSKILQEYVISHLPAEVQPFVEEHVGFPRCVIDQVVTNPSEAEREVNPLLVIAEGEGQWVVDRFGFVGDLPSIKGMKFTDNLDAYVEQKIFTLNTAHAVTGYLGYLKGYEFIHEAVQDADIRPVVLGTMAEINAILVKRHQLDPAEQDQYAANILKRFENTALPDPVIRVGREPLRKLSPNDRLIKPALLAVEAGLTPAHLASGIAAALLYDNPDDPEAATLSHSLQEKGLEAVLGEVSQVPSDSPLIGLVKEKMGDVQKLHKARE